MKFLLQVGISTGIIFEAFTHMGSQVASTFYEAFNVLLDSYQRISESLPLLAQYQSLFQSNAHMVKTLELVYRDIFEFHHLALNYFKKPGICISFCALHFRWLIRCSMETDVSSDVEDIQLKVLGVT